MLDLLEIHDDFHKNQDKAAYCMPLADIFCEKYLFFSGLEFLNRPSQVKDASPMLPFYLVLASSYLFYMYFYQTCFSKCYSNQ